MGKSLVQNGQER